ESSPTGEDFHRAPPGAHAAPLALSQKGDRPTPPENAPPGARLQCRSSPHASEPPMPPSRRSVLLWILAAASLPVGLLAVPLFCGEAPPPPGPPPEFARVKPGMTLAEVTAVFGEKYYMETYPEVDHDDGTSTKYRARHWSRPRSWVIAVLFHETE